MKRYKLEELDTDTRQQAIDRLSQQLAEDFDCSWLTKTLNNELTERGWKGLTVTGWSLSNCQGDGVDFEGSIDLDDDFVKNGHTWLSKPLRAFSLRDVSLTLDVRHSTACRRHHENSMDISFMAFPNDRELTPIEEKVVQLVEAKLTEEIKELSRELKQLGYRELEYVSSEASVLQRIEDYNLEFDETGNELDPLPVDTKQLLLFAHSN